MEPRRRGRPPTFLREERERLAELIRLHGASQAREVADVNISFQTVLKIAHEFGIQLKKGRRPRRAA